MKSLLHHDYWVEIPEGECLIGLSEEQRLFLWRKIRDNAGYAHRPPHEQQRMDELLDKLRQGEDLVYDEAKIFGQGYISSFSPFPSRSVRLKRFYIARYPISRKQYELFRKGAPPTDIPGVLEEPEFVKGRFEKPLYRRCAAEVQTELALEFCKQLGGRLPTSEEWEKAARGTDGRLYPWGNEWGFNRGFFYYGQDRPKACAGGKPPVDTYPGGVSPYGVWAMAGGLPELVVVPPRDYQQIYEVNGERFSIDLKGWHPRNSDKEHAFLDHLVAQNGVGDWAALRPVLDEIPTR